MNPLFQGLCLSLGGDSLVWILVLLCVQLPDLSWWRAPRVPGSWYVTSKSAALQVSSCQEWLLPWRANASCLLTVFVPLCALGRKASDI